MIRTKIEIIRRGRLGFNVLYENQIDEPIVWHHINDNDVVAVPEDIHTLYHNGSDVESHREKMKYIVDQLYPIN